MAKQKIIKQSIASCVLNTVIDLNSQLDSGTLRSFLLGQRSNNNQSVILGLDRDPSSPSSFVATTSLVLRAELLELVDSLPSHSFNTFLWQPWTSPSFG